MKRVIDQGDLVLLGYWPITADKRGNFVRQSSLKAATLEHEIDTQNKNKMHVLELCCGMGHAPPSDNALTCIREVPGSNLGGNAD
jgi:hypothetical protein